jgi:hypothetical protein
MLRLTIVIFILAATVIAGALVTFVLASPALANVKMAIPAAAGVGALVAIPVAYLVAKGILGASRPA